MDEQKTKVAVKEPSAFDAAVERCFKKATAGSGDTKEQFFVKGIGYTAAGVIMVNSPWMGGVMEPIGWICMVCGCIVVLAIGPRLKKK